MIPALMDVASLDCSYLELPNIYPPFPLEDSLISRVAKPILDGLVNVKSNAEEFKLINNIFYLYAPDGIGRSKLAALIEQNMGVPVTARNWNTISRLISMAKE